METPDQLAGKRITVMGLGRFGGGTGVVRFLAGRGAKLTVTDLQDESQLAESLTEIADLPVEQFHLGGHREDDFRETDLIVVNPAVPRGNKWLKIAEEANVPLTSEIGLFLQFNPAQVIGVTGSNGKSTTTALIHHLLQEAGFKANVGGNLGGSLLNSLDKITPDSWVVLELSSFQLAALDRMFCSPRVAVVTNFTPNHLDWHGSIEDYRNSKQTILRWQCADGFAVLNLDDPHVSRWPVHSQPVWFGMNDRGGSGIFAKQDRNEIVFRTQDGEESFSLTETDHLPGNHNLANMLAACGAAISAGVPISGLPAAVKSFKPLPHRLELVGEFVGRRFVNDSISTTPESTVAALESFAEPVVLLAGGYDKQVDLHPMIESIASRTKAVALMGQTAPMLHDHLLRLAHNRDPNARICECFADAFTWAISQSYPGDVVLLSPGCASYDWFRDFDDRGQQFRDAVHRWASQQTN